MGISNIIFVVLLLVAGGLFAVNVNKIISNIRLGRDTDRSDSSAERWKTMIRVALGQSKMTSRPIAGILHIIIYVGFVIINLEMLEIVIDGIAGSHRVFAPLLGDAYPIFINIFELLAVGVLLACVAFLARRNIMRIPRFHKPEMKNWPTSDANIILIVEILLMGAFLTMNAADAKAGMDFMFSSMIKGILPTDSESLYMIERSCWWFHIVGVFAFLNYLPYSKHFHILLAFPATYYSNLQPKGKFTNMEAVTNEVKLMFDPEADPYAAPPEPDPNAEPIRFGAKEVNDLTWKNLMDSYSCTECGRCTSECPANQTGKLLSPRKIMMDTRDRLEEFGKNNGKDDGKSLLHDYITTEELRACTTCNACTEACPINLDPLSIIMEMRRYLIMEESSAPQEWNGMSTNIENNGAPWQFAQADRLNWANEE
ncbi:(Fe-S)-binding protein [Flavobacteriales bacterium]|nr:(Fe-S)-binding protein [Flavobacteriales bacterium]